MPHHSRCVMTMMHQSVRETEVEQRVVEVLEKDPTRIWNVATLAKEIGCSRAKVDRAFIALEAQDKISVERLIGNSWIPRLKRPSSSKRGNGP